MREEDEGEPSRLASKRVRDDYNRALKILRGEKCEDNVVNMYKNAGVEKSQPTPAARAHNAENVRGDVDVQRNSEDNFVHSVDALRKFRRIVSRTLWMLLAVGVVVVMGLLLGVMLVSAKFVFELF